MKKIIFFVSLMISFAGIAADSDVFFPGKITDRKTGEEIRAKCIFNSRADQKCAEYAFFRVKPGAPEEQIGEVWVTESLSSRIFDDTSGMPYFALSGGICAFVGDPTGDHSPNMGIFVTCMVVNPLTYLESLLVPGVAINRAVKNRRAHRIQESLEKELKVTHREFRKMIVAIQKS